MPIKRKCQECGTEFKARPSDVKRGYAKYCCRECAMEARRLGPAGRYEEGSENQVVLMDLPGGLEAKIDAEDVKKVKPYTWCATRSRSDGPLCVAGRDRDGNRVRLHRLIVDAKPSYIVRHVNGDTLDCRRCNLCIVDDRTYELAKDETTNARDGP